MAQQKCQIVSVYTFKVPIICDITNLALVFGSNFLSHLTKYIFSKALMAVYFVALNTWQQA